MKHYNAWLKSDRLLSQKIRLLVQIYTNCANIWLLSKEKKCCLCNLNLMTLSQSYLHSSPAPLHPPLFSEGGSNQHGHLSLPEIKIRNRCGFWSVRDMKMWFWLIQHSTSWGKFSSQLTPLAAPWYSPCQQWLSMLWSVTSASLFLCGWSPLKHAAREYGSQEVEEWELCIDWKGCCQQRQAFCSDTWPDHFQVISW